MNKRVFQWVLAAILTICGTSVFTACTTDNADNAVKPIDNLSQKLIGKWITADLDGKPAVTNRKSVYTFVSANKAYSSASFSPKEKDSYWLDLLESDVVISGNKVTLTNHPDEHETGVEEFIITDITDSEFNANQKVILTVDGKVTLSADFVTRYTKVNQDYSKDILSIWECTGLTGGETFNDANARLEFLKDGTYKYYQKNTAKEWEEVTTREIQQYIVDGNFLATRWKNKGEDELREWWEIKSLKDGKMQWTALRQNTDGTTFQQVMDWEIVK